MISKTSMMDCVCSQLAIDYNCELEDFQKNGLIFTEAKENKGRRPFPFILPRLEIITMGNSVVINVSQDILPFVREQCEGKTCDEVFWMSFSYGSNLYFLPDIGKITPLSRPDGFEYELVEKHSIHELYQKAGFDYALQYDENSPFPEMLVALAKCNGETIGMAGASAGCKYMRQIGVNILPQYRGKGLASTLVNMLTIEILNREYIPYYFTSNSNVLSMHVAVKAGYIPIWVHSYKTRLYDTIQK